MAIKKNYLLYSILSGFLFAVFFLYLKALLYLYSLQQTVHSVSLFTVGIDFSMFYAAFSIAQTTSNNNPYDVATLMAALHSLHQTDNLSKLGFFYPPFFLLLIAPFSLLPYPLALLSWNAIFLCSYVYTIYRIAPTRITIALALSFPGVFFNLLWSQNGFLLTVLLGAFLLVRGSNAKEGLFLALLAIKPQIAILPYFVSFINKKWHVFVYTILFLSLFVLISACLFGTTIWSNFISSMSTIRDLTLIALWWNEQTSIRISIQDSLRIVGMSHNLAATVQIVFTALILFLNYKIRHWPNIRMKNVITISSVLLVTPYAMQYDLILLSLPIGLYAYELFITKKKLPGELIMLAFLWFSPLTNYVIVHQYGIQTAPLIILILLLFALRRLLIISNTTTELSNRT